MNWWDAALQVAYLYKIGPEELGRMKVPEILEWHEAAQRLNRR